MVIKGSGGEGKSQIGHVLSRMFGPNAKDGSVGKISENPFARADLEHIHLMIDDDMRLEALKQTNYIKAIVTAKGKIDLERFKGRARAVGEPCTPASWPSPTAIWFPCMIAATASSAGS